MGNVHRESYNHISDDMANLDPAKEDEGKAKIEADLTDKFSAFYAKLPRALQAEFIELADQVDVSVNT